MLIFIFALMIFFLAEGLYEGYQKETFISQLQPGSGIKYLDEVYYIYELEDGDAWLYNIHSTDKIRVNIHRLQPIEPYKTLSYYGAKTFNKVFKLE